MVKQIISTGFKVSARVGGLSVLLAVLIGVPLGSIAALNRGKWIDNVIIVFTTSGIAVPSFVVSTVLMLIFSVKLGWLPTYGLSSPFALYYACLRLLPCTQHRTLQDLCVQVCWRFLGRTICVLRRQRACLSL